MAAVAFAREHGLELAVRGGGHNVAGTAVADGGLVVDCSPMDSVRVDPDAERAWVEPGARLHDVDVETQAHDLVVPAGFVSTTGVAGLTLGGGFGYLSRKHGLTVDSLRSVELVTADGEFVRASEDEHPALFWALRGGGGNFGVVTAFEFELHELASPILAGPVAYHLDDAPAVLREVAAAVDAAPDEVACLVAMRTAPPAPFLPEDVHGAPVLLVVLLYAGDAADGEDALAPLRVIGDPIADAVGPKPYAVFQTTFDEASAPGARNYWKSHYLPTLSGAAIDVMCAHAADIESPESTLGMMAMGGEIACRPADATPYQHRDAEWAVNIQSRWRKADEVDEHVSWARDAFDALTPHATGGVYVNFISRDERERIHDAFDAATYERLAAVKAEWDPENVFHRNQNIEPAA
jgi:FAD/FMN-containing dehydrogenase